MANAIDDILGPGGAIARRLGTRYEERPEQLHLAREIATALDRGEHLLAEAGTGVGKSFAYLVPVIDWAVRKKKRVVISTHTISLQEQLIEKDIPTIRSVYPNEFSAVLVKGRNNYLCKRRLDQATARQSYLFETSAELSGLHEVRQWAERTTDGSLSDLPSVPLPQVWDKVAAEAGNCMGKKCNHFDHCFWQAAKRRMQSGNVLVVNHALFFSDLALRMAGVNYLPKYDVAVLDEAHTVEEVAGQHFGIKVSEAGVKYTLRNLYDLRRGRGLLSTFGAVANDAIGCVVDLNEMAEVFFESALLWQTTSGRGNGRIREAGVVENILSPKLRELTTRLRGLVTHTQKEEEIAELTSLSNKVETMAGALEALVNQQMPDAVYWLDVAGAGGTGQGGKDTKGGRGGRGGGGSSRRVTWHAAPVDVAEGLRRHLFGKMHSVVMTSATLCTRGGESAGPKRPPAAEAPRAATEAFGARLTQRGGVAFVHLRPAHTSGITPEIASPVEQAIRQFEGERYDLIAWSVRPDGVRAVVRPLGDFSLPAILHSWQTRSVESLQFAEPHDQLLWNTEPEMRAIATTAELDAAVREAAPATPDTNAGVNDEALQTARDFVSPEAAPPPPAEPARAKGPLVPTGFGYVSRRLGVAGAVAGDLKPKGVRYLQVGSPFDYESQCTLYVEADLPDPGDRLFFTHAKNRVLKYLRQSRGGAFVLFTAYKPMLEMAAALKNDIEDMGCTLLVHGQAAPRKVLLERFREIEDAARAQAAGNSAAETALPTGAVLFGTSSFWQGIDVQGDALRNVIIVKLPFSVPDEPLTEAKLEAITRDGGNAFMEYSVPEAIIRLKQGFGRLIRSRTDRGIVVILDSRVVTKRYGRLFLDSLPKCRVVEVREEYEEQSQFEGYGPWDESQV